MSCSPFDLREYFLKELPEAGERQVEAHVKTCAACREELARLGLTQAALLSVRDEEVPQRIAFVSDQVFEPSLVRRWLAGFWGSTARLGFASAAMLSAALLVTAFTRPAPAPARASNVSTAAAISTAEIDQRIQAAVTKAVAESEARQTQKAVELIRSVEQRAEQEHKSAMVARADADMLQRRNQYLEMARGDYGPPRADGGDLK